MIDANPTERLRLSFLPIPALIVLMAIVYLTVAPSVFFDPPWLILIGNTLFVTIVSLVVSYFALKNYRATGRIQILMMGCGVLIFGIGGFLAAIVRDFPGGANLNVTIYNMGALMGAAFHFVAALILLAGISPEVGFKRRSTYSFFGYTASVVFMILLTIASLKGMMPLFFMQGVGPTFLRQLVLGTADILFVFSFLIFMGTYLRNKEVFLYWYACALALTAISLTAFFIQSSVGSPVGWVGRLSQYIGGAYFLASLVTAAQTAQIQGTSLDNILTASLSGVEEKFRALAENTPDVIRRFDRELRQIYVNTAGLRLYGKPAGDIIGKPLHEAGLPVEQSRLWTERILKVFQTGQLMEVEDYLPIEKGMAFYQSQCVPEHSPEGAVANVLVVSRDLTERKQMEDALRDSEERYRSLFNGMTEGFALHEIICDEGGEPYDYRFLDINPAFEQLTGLKREGVIGRTHNQILPDDDPSWVKEYGTVALTGNPTQFENYSPALGRHYEVFAYCPAPRQFAVVFMDVTKRKRAEEALRESEQKYFLLFERTAIAAALTKLPENVFADVNDAFEKLFGYTKQEVVGKTSLELGIAKPEEQAVTVDEIEQRGLQHDAEKHVRTKSGEERIILLNVNALEFGGQRYALSTMQDITERKQAEEAFHETRDYLESLIDYANAPIIVWDPSFKITRFNHASERLTGIRAAEALGEPLAILFPEDSRDQSLDHIHRALAGERLEAVEIPILKTDGSIREVLWNSANIYAGNGTTIIATIAQGQDITDRKRAEEELRKARDELELRVQERTAELSNAKEELECMNEELRVEIEEHRSAEEALLVAKDAAEAAAQAKSDFMANMSHEIRTPMNAVIGMTSLLLEDETLNSEQKDFVETIRMSGDALMVVINDILDFSKMQENKVVLEDQPFDLRACVEEALDLVAGKASENGLNLAYTIDKNVPNFIIGDPNRLRQILSNLLINAVKFTESGEVKLFVSGQMIEDRHEIHFAVHDTGIGISRDQIDQLFQPFSQVDASVTRNYGGTGLGLVISKKLVELMEGKIWAESEPGKGSIFHFTIKAETALDDSKKDIVGDQPQLVGKHVLIVNDNKTNRRILGAYIYSWGMVPLLASTSREALDWIRRGDTFDVAILDIDMQDMDGRTLADEVRRYNKALPLVMLTSIGRHLPPDHACLTKPIKPSQLHRVLASIISMQQTQKSDRSKAVDKEIQMSSLRILLAEDNVTSQKVAKQMLKRLGYRVDVVANGIEALQALERQPYDVVLMDLRMPEMGGLQATRIIRQRWPDGGPKVIAVTAYALQGDKEKCIEAGMDDYISKPIKMNEVAEVLRKYQTTEIQ